MCEKSNKFRRKKEPQRHLMMIHIFMLASFCEAQQFVHVSQDGIMAMTC
jgi:hypothetical protein